MIDAGRNAPCYRPYLTFRNNDMGFTDSLIRDADSPSGAEKDTIPDKIGRVICGSGGIKHIVGKSMVKLLNLFGIFAPIDFIDGHRQC